jgi:hypothetical protein
MQISPSMNLFSSREARKKMAGSQKGCFAVKTKR